MIVYGLREVRAMIVKERSVIATQFPRSNDPYIRGQRDALKRMDELIAKKIRVEIGEDK